MLQLLVCADVHTYTDNLRLAVEKTGGVDAILIAGDLEAEAEEVFSAAGNIPCYPVSGNNDYYLNSDYPEELIIDLSAPFSSFSPQISEVRELQYTALPETYSSLPAGLRNLPFGLSLKLSSQKRPSGVVHRIFMTHGKEYNVPELRLLKQRAALWDADIIIFGHTHKFLYLEEKDGKTRILNPGCLIGSPHDTIRSYGGYETCSFALLRIGFQNEVSVRHLYL